MKAETAYNVCMALPSEELQRLLLMLEDKKTFAKAAKRKSAFPIWTRQECMDEILPMLRNRRRPEKET